MLHHKIGILSLIYCASVCYVIAAYYHLKMNDNWSFLSALCVALPIVVIEYVFSLHGNFFAHKYLGWSSIQILVITISFYFVNLWILNRFILGKVNKSVFREIIAFILVLCAFMITTVIS